LALLIAVAILAVLLISAIELFLGHRSIISLSDADPDDVAAWPSLSVVVAARNEAQHIEEAVRSLLAQDYPDFDLIVVDDRSEDETGLILDRLARDNPRLTVVHVTELPPDWLGKTHALHLGATRSRGELLLFTDADILYSPGTLRKGVAVLLERRLDHLTVGPNHLPRGPMISMAVGMFFLFVGLALKPWRARDPESRYFIGIGAFNLVRRSSYEAMGGHQVLAMRPDDDIKLAKLLKRSGARQDIAFSDGAIHVEWYPTVRQMVQGLTKNLFAGADYSLTLIFLGSLGLVMFIVWPFLAVLVTNGSIRWVYGLACFVVLCQYLDCARVHRLPLWSAIGVPFATLLIVFVLWKSALTTLLTGGITWRGTHYPLDRLKRNRV